MNKITGHFENYHICAIISFHGNFTVKESYLNRI